MNRTQQNYINARRTLNTIREEGVAAYDPADRERLALAEELHTKALRDLIDWGIGKCMALAQTEIEREAFHCLQNHARRAQSAGLRVAELCLKLED